MLSFKESCLMEGKPSPLLVKNPHLSELPKLSDKEAKKQRLELAYKELLPAAQSIKQRLYAFLKASATGVKDAKILIGIKPLKSVISKVVERGKPATGLSDLVRSAVLFDTYEEVKHFVDQFVKKYHAYIVDKETKKAGTDKVYGYFGSFHLGVMINGLLCEIQVMTKKLWAFKDKAHQIYNRYRDSGKPAEFDAVRSKHIFRMGNLDKMVREHAEFSEGLEELTE